MHAVNRWKAIQHVALSVLLMATASAVSANEDVTLGAVRTLASAGAETAPSALDLLAKGIGDRRLVLLGEMHGTQEIPALTGDLVARYTAAGEPVILALEIDSREQARVDRYLASRGGDADRRDLLAGEHWQDAMHDGRDSAAMLALLERVRVLRVAQQKVSIVLFDQYGEGDRDVRMAQALRVAVTQHPGARVFVLTGNMHATVRPPSDLVMDGKRMRPPMTAGRLLVDLVPLSINVSALGGESWICQRGTCAIHPYFDPRASRAPAFTNDAPDSPWDATLTLQRFTPSQPALEITTPPAAR